MEIEATVQDRTSGQWSNVLLGATRHKSSGSYRTFVISVGSLLVTVIA